MILSDISGKAPKLAPNQVATAEPVPYDLSVEQAATEATRNGMDKTNAKIDLLRTAGQALHRHQVEIDYVEDTQPIPVTHS